MICCSLCQCCLISLLVRCLLITQITETWLHSRGFLLLTVSFLMACPQLLPLWAAKLQNRWYRFRFKYQPLFLYPYISSLNGKNPIKSALKCNIHLWIQLFIDKMYSNTTNFKSKHRCDRVKFGDGKLQSCVFCHFDDRMQYIMALATSLKNTLDSQRWINRTAFVLVLYYSIIKDTNRTLFDAFTASQIERGCKPMYSYLCPISSQQKPYLRQNESWIFQMSHLRYSLACLNSKVPPLSWWTATERTSWWNMQREERGQEKLWNNYSFKMQEESYSTWKQRDPPHGFLSRDVHKSVIYPLYWLQTCKQWQLSFYLQPKRDQPDKPHKGNLCVDVSADNLNIYSHTF